MQDKTWCVAKPSATDAELSANLEFACVHVDCTTIQPNGPCFNPNTFINHASVAMNLYYSFHGRNLWNCDYQKSGLITKTDPSKIFFIWFVWRIPICLIINVMIYCVFKDNRLYCEFYIPTWCNHVFLVFVRLWDLPICLVGAQGSEEFMSMVVW